MIPSKSGCDGDEVSGCCYGFWSCSCGFCFDFYSESYRIEICYAEQVDSVGHGRTDRRANAEAGVLEGASGEDRASNGPHDSRACVAKDRTFPNEDPLSHHGKGEVEVWAAEVCAAKVHRRNAGGRVDEAGIVLEEDEDCASLLCFFDASLYDVFCRDVSAGLYGYRHRCHEWNHHHRCHRVVSHHWFPGFLRTATDDGFPGGVSNAHANAARRLLPSSTWILRVKLWTVSLSWTIG